MNTALKLLTSTQQQIDTVDLVLHYKLWSGLTSTASVFDYSLNGFDGTVISAPPPVYPGFQLDGTADYINTGATFQTTFGGSFTLSIWFKPDDGRPSAGENLFGNNQDGTDIIDCQIRSTGSLQFYYESNNFSANAITDVVLNDGAESWHNAIFVADATIGGVGGLVIYFDGTLLGLPVNDGNTVGVTFADFVTTRELAVGAKKAAAASAFFAGKLGDVRFYNVVKSAAQAKSIFETTRSRYGV